MYDQVLERAGLTKNEGRVYLTLLREGMSTSSKILMRGAINSGKIYEILDSLKRKGLVTESSINNVRYFEAANPDQILYFLDEKKNSLVNDASFVKEHLTKLTSLNGKKNELVYAKTYLGLKGIRTAADTALASIKKGEEIVAMGINPLKDKTFNTFWQGWSQKRVTKGIVAKHIFSRKGRFLDEMKKLKLSEFKVLEGIAPVTVDVFGEHTVIIFNYDEPCSAILIQSKNTAKSFRNFFYQLWTIAKK